MQPSDEDEEKGDQFFSFLQVTEHRWNEIDRGKPVSVSLCPPQIPNGLAWDGTRTSAVTGR
jgi:hypothetical protein